jgi:hypothetical protein
MYKIIFHGCFRIDCFFCYNPWISAAGTCFPRGGPGASSTLKAPAGSPVTSLSRRSQVPSASIHFRLILKFVSIGFDKIHSVSHLAVDWSERRRSSQNATAFRSCGEYSRKLIQRPAGNSGLWRPRRHSRGGSTIAPRKAKPIVEINSVSTIKTKLF